MTCTTGDPCALMTSPIGIDQPFQKSASHLVHGMTNGELSRLQIQAADRILVMKDVCEDQVNFPLRFLKNLLRNFF